MKIEVIAVAKIKERGLREVADDYVARISRYTRFREVELKDGDEQTVRDRFERAIEERAYRVALEVDGKALGSHDLAKKIETLQTQGTPAITFLIGGSYGLPKELSQATNLQLSLSAMTLPHRLARILLLEQIYRAFAIIHNEPYSH